MGEETRIVRVHWIVAQARIPANALMFQHNNPSCAAMAIKVEHNNGLAMTILCLLHMSTHTQITL